MSIAQLGITAGTTLIAVLLGGILTTRAQDRLWHRDNRRQWRDIRLSAYSGFLAAFREYVAYVLQPPVQIVAVEHRGRGDLMPFFDETGTPYRERLEAAKTTLRLVSGTPQVVEASSALVRQARWLAADRATHSVETMPPERFEQLWAAERAFVDAARDELGLAGAFGSDDALEPAGNSRPAQRASVMSRGRTRPAAG
jgi:hypothetical protein